MQTKLATVAAETSNVLSELDWLEQIWHESTHRSNEPPSRVPGQAAG
jgi:hypothetical protein